jgi:PAS domain S-box-containing protein
MKMRSIPYVERGQKSALRRYGAATLFLALVLFLRIALNPVLGDASPYLASFLAIVLSAWYGGSGPGYYTTIISGGLVTWFIVGPGALLSVAEFIRLAFFLLQGTLVSYLFGAFMVSRRRLADVLESVSDGFSALDHEWRFVYVNQRAAEMSHLTREQMLGHRIWDLFPDVVNTEFYRRLHEVASQRKPATFEYRYPQWDTWYTFGVYPSVEGVVLFTQEITHVKQARKAMDEVTDKIERINVDLEQRVDERTAQLNSTIRELEAFSYSISHDLRAPLRAIDGFSKMLYDDYHSSLDDEGKRLIEIIRNNTTNMGRLIDGLLAFSRLGRQQMGHTHFAMGDLVKDAIEEVRGGMNGRNVEFRVGNLPDAEGDRILLRQVLINILSNAVKFSRDRNPAIIEVGSHQEQDRNTFYVRDNGVGFESRYADKMFGVFQRLHAATEFEGSGLGLAIVQRIVHRHGGRVWAEGTPGQGATVYFSLPKANGINAGTRLA